MTTEPDELVRAAEALAKVGGGEVDGPEGIRRHLLLCSEPVEEHRLRRSAG